MALWTRNQGSAAVSEIDQLRSGFNALFERFGAPFAELEFQSVRCLCLVGLANLKGFPPIMVHAGAAEILRDDASKLSDRAADASTPVSVEIYDGMDHLFQADAKANEAKVSLARLGQFIRSKTGIPLQAQTA